MMIFFHLSRDLISGRLLDIKTFLSHLTDVFQQHLFKMIPLAIIDYQHIGEGRRRFQLIAPFKEIFTNAKCKSSYQNHYQVKTLSCLIKSIFKVLITYDTMLPLLSTTSAFRDQPFLIPGTRAQRIWVGYEKILTIFDGARKIFATISWGAK